MAIRGSRAASAVLALSITEAVDAVAQQVGQQVRMGLRARAASHDPREKEVGLSQY